MMSILVDVMNKMLILCLEFFNALKIFYSYDDLNSRLNKLI